MKMRFQGYGVDLTTTAGMINGGSSVKPQYVMTSVEANNDSLIGWYTSFEKDIPLIIKGGSYVLTRRDMLKKHLEYLGRDKAEVLLLSPETPWENLDKEELPTVDYGVLNPTSVEQLEEIKKKHKFTYISIDVSPLFYNNEVIEWAKEQRVSIIGTNQFGGLLSAPRNIQTFSVPFLLKFSAANVDIVMVSGRNTKLAFEDMAFLEECIGQEGAEEFYMRKTIDKLVKPIKRAIDTFMSADCGSSLKYDSPELIFSDTTTALAGKKKESLGSLAKDSTEPLQQYLDELTIPEDFSKAEKLALIKYQATDFLRIDYRKEDGWNFYYGVIPSSVVSIKINKPRKPKKHFWSKYIPEENVNYLIYLTEDGTIIVKKDKLEP